ncbi:MAG TPA: MoxR family ATPase [Myxococcaceae bacterium]|nr:MoxR family ATPase [Myxococcaceae bacterium]
MSQPARAVSAPLSPTLARALLEQARTALAAVVVGKEQAIELALGCLVGGGHLLIEDVPGTGKTTLAASLAQVFSLGFARIQFTADLMPADVLGAQIYRAQDATFHFRKGPLFQQLVLADELNRAPPRTQSALLEAMAHGQVSVDGTSHPLPRPFAVVATQNPLDLTGTYPLPDSQLDRFQIRLTLGHPSAELEARLLLRGGAQKARESLQPIGDAGTLVALQQLAQRVDVSADVAHYAVALARATREHPELERGVSTRSALGLMAQARAMALWEGRDFVTPGDLRSLLVPCWSHRLLTRGAVEGSFQRDESAHLLDELARRVPAPV